MSRKGFTLLEILIATFILAAVLSTVYTSYTGTFRVVNQTESEAEIYQMACVAFERIIEDLESVYVPEKPESAEPEDAGEPLQFAGEDRQIEGRSADNLHFTSRAHLVFGEQHQPFQTAEIGYYVEEDEEGNGLVLYRSDMPQLSGVSQEDTRGLALCKNLVSVNFAYYNARGEIYDGWDASSEDGIPQIVSITLEFVNPFDPEVPVKFFTSVALPLGQQEE